MKIGIIGYGFVGKALENGFNILAKYLIDEIVLFDPKIDGSNIESVKPCDFVFVCVPTPMMSSGEMDVSIVKDVLTKLEIIGYTGLVVIKSTTTPVKIKELIGSYQNLNIITNPEFLTERSANKDFLESAWIVIGDDGCYSDKLIQLYEKMWPAAKIIKVSPEAAMMAKYMTNSWFATKVSLMNEFKKLWDKLDYGSWDDVVKAFGADVRVGPTHLQVPGPDGDFGFGGKCFAKDLNAVMFMCNENMTPFNVMKGAWKTNNEVRTNKDWLSIDGAVSKDYSEQSSKRSLFWMIDISKMNHITSVAKLRQFHDYIKNLKFEGIDNIYVIGGDQNKFYISDLEVNVRNKFKDEAEYLKWFTNVKSQMVECLNHTFDVSNIK